MKSFRNFFSEVTDIDNRLLRTFLQLFRNPTEVIEASLKGQNTYTKPLRYILFTSTLFIVWRFIFDEYVEGLFVDDFGIDDWWLPERIAKANAQFNSLFDTLFPFQILFFVVPAAIVLLKVFFIKKLWSEVSYIALYSFGQFWIVMIISVPVLVIYGFSIVITMVSFVLIGFFFRKLLSHNVWVALGKWTVLVFLLTTWFYGVSLRTTQSAIIQITLPDRYNEVPAVAEPINEVLIRSDEETISTLEPIKRDSSNRVFLVKQVSGGMQLTCVQPLGTVLWQTLLPEAEWIREAFSVQLTATETGFLVLVDAQIVPKISHAILLSTNGKILFTKIYKEEMVLNGGDFVNGQLILSGGKSNGKGTTPFIDIIKLTWSPDISAFQFLGEETHFFADVGHRFDDVHVLNRNTTATELVVSKYETNKTNTSYVGAVDINRISILKIRIDSIPNLVWEKEIFSRKSKYSPLRDQSFQMQYSPAQHLITAYYSLADQQRTSAYLFSLDTAGEIRMKQRVSANELTYVTDTYLTKEGTYFCGWTEMGMGSPLLNFGRQGLIGFVSKDGEVSMANVGNDKQGHYLYFSKIVADDSLLVYDLCTIQNLFLAGNLNGYWRVLEFKKDLLVPLGNNILSSSIHNRSR